MRLALPIVVVVALVLAGRWLAGATTVAAIAQLGLTAGWRCANASVYTYDPRRETADSGLVAEAPEALAPADVETVRVEVNLRDADTTVWTQPIGAGRDTQPTRVFVLSPGALQAIAVDAGGQQATICYSHLGRWKVVGDQALQ